MMVLSASNSPVSSAPALVKTCETCVRAKIRCLRTPGSPVCDRCRRLNKDCFFRPARSRYNPAKRETRIEALEGKVNQLLGQIHNESQAGSSPSADGDTTPRGESGPSARTSQDVISRGIVTFDHASSLLDGFRRTMMPHFPFVIIPEKTTLQELREEKPFLLLAVLTVSLYQNLSLRRVFMEEFRSAARERMLFGMIESPFEVLQGLLVSLGWSQYIYQPRQFTTYFHLALSIVVDMWLDRPPELRSCCSRSEYGPNNLSPAHLAAVARDEKRAVLGCFVISSCVSIIMQKRCTFPWTPHIERFAMELAQDPEYPSDEYTIHLVRLQRVFERIDEVSISHPPGMQGRMPEMERHIYGFRQELEDFKGHLSCARINTLIISMQFHTLELYLTQVSLFDKFHPASSYNYPSPSTSNPDAPPSFHPRRQREPSMLPGSMNFRVDSLCRGLVAAERYFDSVLTWPVGVEHNISYMQWVQIGFILAISAKLAVAASDPCFYRQERVGPLCDALNMPLVLNNCRRRMQALSNYTVDESGERDVYYHYDQWLRHIHEWFDRNYCLPQPDGLPSAPPATRVAPPPPPPAPSAPPAPSVPSAGVAPGPVQMPPATMPVTAPYFPPQSRDGSQSGQMVPTDNNGLAWLDTFQDATTEEIMNGWMALSAVPL
ncbi:hypothetical protein P170DRAFT_435591 [Aspergillus steynii IBT 23096]|uniref:Zn(2)-C6 fungal-type domain-containing protein n=1 Tax=Aspergillus steynii IBT 23096 TaxID=1392250 RepID=A0A2I2GBZ7_9EURO|nr:uncharacterized protein P170DRAFT_435591 [Aspergillus steynii IBT 23096]PLB50403.1 hypothetical protein P170DRAFT_435591 [Aspergillus steynii IBT 23096]